jgi:hypothetical protein
MSNGARHALGAVVGLVATAIVSVCLMIGTDRLRLVESYSVATFARRSYHGHELWEGLGLVLVAAVLLGLVAGSRLSPIASLVPGAAFTAAGLLWALDPGWAMQHTVDQLPKKLSVGYLNLAGLGVYLLIGLALVAASVPPSRWRARTAGGAPRYAGPPPAPMGPPPAAPGAPGAPSPLGAPQAPAQDTPWGRPPQYGQQPSPQSPAQPQYGRSAQPGVPQAPSPSAPPAQSPARPASGAVPFEDNDAQPPAQGGGSGEGVGEWTQMYGGDDLRGNR